MNRRQLLTCVASATIVGILTPLNRSFLARAAGPMVDLPVTITKTDGTSVKGKITAYDRDKVTIDAIAKPKDPTVSTVISWDDIQKVSNGLTREKALQKWKGEHHDSLCLTCHGDGKTFCPKCHGTNHDIASSAGCPTCKGAAEIACTTPKCDHGTIDCPNPKCLKLSDTGWTKKPDGTMVKKLSGKNNTHVEFNDSQIGHVIEKVNGEWQNLGECPVCGGVSKISDPVCRGTFEMPCPTCVKRAGSPPCPNKCDAGLVVCATCKGTGMKV